MTETETETETETAVTSPENTNIHIKANNPDKEGMALLCEKIQANYDFAVTVTPTDFRFKKAKDKVTGIETTRDIVALAVPLPSVQGIIDILEKDNNEKEVALLLDCVAGEVNSACRDILAEDPNINAENFPYASVSFLAIANTPKATRRGSAIPKETWEAFVLSYIAHMVSVVGKTTEQATLAAGLFVNKYQKCKTDKAVLEFLVTQLALYAEAKDATDFVEVIDFLASKAEDLLKAEPADLLGAL